MKKADFDPDAGSAPARPEDSVPKAVRTVSYWDEYAPWYKLWLDHTNYHRGLKDLLARWVLPGWRVLDIGGGSGVLAVPLAKAGCRVTVVEPSEAMREFLAQELWEKKAAVESVIPLPWEDIASGAVSGFDLILASNSLHLTSIGTAPSLRRILAARPRHVLVVSELEIPFEPGGNGDSAYEVGGAGSFRADNSFRYHSVDEALSHLDLKDRHGQDHPSRQDFVRSLVFEDGHFVLMRRTTVRWLRLDRKAG